MISLIKLINNVYCVLKIYQKLLYFNRKIYEKFFCGLSV